MIPELKCSKHHDEIVLLDISKNPPKKSRSYCFECLNECQPTQSIAIKKLANHLNQQTFETPQNKQYNIWITKIEETINQLNTLKKKIINELDGLISDCEKQLHEIKPFVQQDFYQNLFKDLSINKLDMIGDILSGNHQIPKQDIEKLCPAITNSLNGLILDESKTIQEIKFVFQNQMNLQSSLKQEEISQVLACNQKFNLIVGSRRNDILILQQNDFNLKGNTVLIGHKDLVTSIVIYDSGDIIVSGGSDKSIKLWKKVNFFWACLQTFSDHTERITELQLSQNEKHLVSASDDKKVKVWYLKETRDSLECIQTIDDQNKVFWITISMDFRLMVTSSSTKYVNLYINQQFSTNPWKLEKQIETIGIIHRICFINNTEFVVQQVDPPQLLVYAENGNGGYLPTSSVILKQPDDQFICSPIFYQGNMICVKNENFLYIIRRFSPELYEIQQILDFPSCGGCFDFTGQGIIVRNVKTKAFEIYK